MKTMLLALLITLPCSADELILRDGKRISWKALSDDGDAYSIETANGQKMTVRKSDVDRISIARPESAAPLTGASFAFDVKHTATTDLIPKVDLHGVDAWKLAGRSLAATASWPTRQTVTFDVDVPDEYDLTATIERADAGNKDFAVGIVAGGAQCAFHFDSWDASASSLALIDGAESEKAPGGIFKQGKPRTVRLMVRKSGLVVQLDGKDFAKLRPDWSHTTVHSAVHVSSKSRLFLVAAGGSWKVSTFTLTSVKS